MHTEQCLVLKWEPLLFLGRLIMMQKMETPRDLDLFRVKAYISCIIKALQIPQPEDKPETSNRLGKRTQN